MKVNAVTQLLLRARPVFSNCDVASENSSSSTDCYVKKGGLFTWQHNGVKDVLRDFASCSFFLEQCAKRRCSESHQKFFALKVHLNIKDFSTPPKSAGLVCYSYH